MPGFLVVFPRCSVAVENVNMAVLLRITVTPADQDRFDELDARVEQGMSQAGGPPSGPMSHVVYAEGDGFVVADVWRTEADGLHYFDGVLRPLLDELGLTAEETTMSSVWSFARP